MALVCYCVISCAVFSCTWVPQPIAKSVSPIAYFLEVPPLICVQFASLRQMRGITIPFIVSTISCPPTLSLEGTLLVIFSIPSLNSMLFHLLCYIVYKT